MVTKIKGKFLSKDYQLSLFRKMKNLMRKLMTVKEYIEEFYKINIREGHIEDTLKRVVRYTNSLVFEIQDEISFLSPRIVEDAYHFSLKVEEKMARKSQGKK